MDARRLLAALAHFVMAFAPCSRCGATMLAERRVWISQRCLACDCFNREARSVYPLHQTHNHHRQPRTLEPRTLEYEFKTRSIRRQSTDRTPPDLFLRPFLLRRQTKLTVDVRPVSRATNSAGSFVDSTNASQRPRAATAASRPSAATSLAREPC